MSTMPPFPKRPAALLLFTALTRPAQAHIIQKQGLTEVTKFNLSYQAGLGVDVVVSEKEGGSGIMLFLKGGTDGIIGSRSWDIHGVKYDADIKQGACRQGPLDLIQQKDIFI